MAINEVRTALYAFPRGTVRVDLLTELGNKERPPAECTSGDDLWLRKDRLSEWCSEDGYRCGNDARKIEQRDEGWYRQREHTSVQLLMDDSKGNRVVFAMDLEELHELVGGLAKAIAAFPKRRMLTRG